MPKLLQFHYWRKRVATLDWKFLIRWVIFNTVFWGLAAWEIDTIYAVAQNVILRGSQNIGQTATMALFGGVFGGIVGMAQWFVLRRKVRRSFWWVLTTATGCAIIWAIPWSVNSILKKILAGLLVGFLQWLVLRHRYRKHYWWIAASSVSWAAAAARPQGLAQIAFLAKFSGHWPIINMLMSGLIYGICSGAALMWIFQHPLPVGIKTQLKKITVPHIAIFIASWIIMHAVGWVIGFGSIGQMLRDIMVAKIGVNAPVILEKAAFECFAAIGVWFVLWRQLFRRSLWWIIWSGSGAAIAIAVWTYFGLENATGIVVYGAIVGFFQWFVLTQKLDGFFSWMCVRSLGWAGSLVVVSRIGRRIHVDAGWFAGGLLYGMITGALLFWRMRGKQKTS